MAQKRSHPRFYILLTYTDFPSHKMITNEWTIQKEKENTESYDALHISKNINTI